MKMVKLPVAFVPLVDAAPLIVAEEMGFAREEGIALDLVAAPSWSSVRDMLAFGRVDAAHMLSPVPVAMAMGLGGVTTALSAVSVLSVNGNVIGVGKGLEAKLRAIGLSAGIEEAQLEACLTDGDTAQALVSWYEENAEADEINSTPTFLINGEKYSNMAWPDMAEIIDGLIEE